MGRRIKLLLDTHVLLWALCDPGRLSAEASALMREPSNKLVVSTATAGAIATKHRIGKRPDAAPLLQTYSDYLNRLLGAVELTITSRHALAAGQRDWVQRDPFDRLLAAHCLLESLTLVTADAVFQSLDGRRTFAAR